MMSEKEIKQLDDEELNEATGGTTNINYGKIDDIEFAYNLNDKVDIKLEIEDLKRSYTGVIKARGVAIMGCEYRPAYYVSGSGIKGWFEEDKFDLHYSVRPVIVKTIDKL